MQRTVTRDVTEQLNRDFLRNTWCVLGLPFDEVSMCETVEQVTFAVSEKKNYFISTPNLYFLCASQKDKDFRHSVIESDLSVADGMSIILLARILNIPLNERVAGSDLINFLSEKKTDNKIKVFFFGGRAGVAKEASLKLNQLNTGLKSVGYYDPGFVDVEEMSTDQIISVINANNIDFLIVSLGAKKGQAWIERNKHRLNVSVVSHLGAVVNFFAGTVKRSPIWMQESGLEWFWRIIQEPSLWKRYFDDGIQFIRLFFLSIFPYWFWLKFRKSGCLVESPLKVSFDDKEKDSLLIILDGCCCRASNDPLREVFKQAVLSNKHVIIDIASVSFVDGHFIGLCLLLEKYLTKNEKKVNLINSNPIVKKIAKWNRVEYLLS